MAKSRATKAKSRYGAGGAAGAKSDGGRGGAMGRATTIKAYTRAKTTTTGGTVVAPKPGKQGG
jgi:hypothetical protein